MPRLVDTHCHPQHEAFRQDREDVLARTLDQLAWIGVVGDDAPASLAAAAMAGEPGISGRVFAIGGIHPHNAAKADEGQINTVRRLLTDRGVVALGEIGLDYHYEFSPRTVQRELLRTQLDMAVELGVPAVVLIDFDYPNEEKNYWHTPEDTIDKVDPWSLAVVGRTLEAFLLSRY